MSNYRVIGKPVERVDGPEMLTGQAIYGPDVNLIIPQQEQNNPNFHGCIDRAA